MKISIDVQDEEKSKEQLLKEVRQLRARVRDLETHTAQLHTTEAALRAAKDYAETIINSSLDMIIAVDEQRRITEFNPAAEKVFGYRKDEVLGQDVSILYDQPPDGVAVSDKLQEGSGVSRSIKNRRKNGEVFDTHLEASVLLDAHGQRVGVMGISRDISQQMRERETQARLTAILEGALDCVGISVPGGEMVYLNRAGRRLLGIGEDEPLSGLNVLDFHPESARIQISTVIPILLQEGQWQGETTMRSRDGRLISVSQVVLAHRGPDGDIQFFSTLTRDISEPKEIERALRESEEKYRNLVENISEVIYTIDVSGRLTYVSPVVSVLGDFTADDILGHTFDEFVHPEDLPEVMNSFSRVLRGDLHPSEFRVRKKSGDYVWVRSSSRPMHDNGKVIGLRGVLTDISANKRVEEALRESEARYRSLFENANDAIATLTLDNVLTSVNGGAERLLGWPREELLGQHASKVASPTTMALVESRTRRFLAGDKPSSSTFEAELIHKDGHVIPVEARTRAIRDLTGKPIGFQGTYRDISAKKVLERQRGDFLAMLAHDIKNPLAAILGYLDLLAQEQAQLSAALGGQFTQRIRENAQAILALVTNYLDIARAEAGNLILQKMPLSIDSLLRRVVQQFSGIAQRHHVNLSLQAEKELPSITGDPMALERVFSNLIRNALKFTPETGQITVSVLPLPIQNGNLHSRAESNGKAEIIVEVTDTGSGIAPKDIPFLFQKYRQADTPRSQDSTGLGLFVVKTFVEAHSGRVEVESTLGVGSRFRVILPVEA